jgi:CRISPR/Cas system CMR-associated protein Cmr5 small subunit
MDKVEKIRAQKATLAKQMTRKVGTKEEINPKGAVTSSAIPTVVVVNGMNVTPGRKSHKAEMTAEDLEYCDRTEKCEPSPAPSP